jgi:hypothetical protein
MEFSNREISMLSLPQIKSVRIEFRPHTSKFRGACSEIPYSSGQGIFAKEQGIALSFSILLGDDIHDLGAGRIDDENIVAR